MTTSEFSKSREKDIVIAWELKVKSDALIQKLSKDIAIKFLNRRHNNPGRTEIDDASDLFTFISKVTSESSDINSLENKWFNSLDKMFQEWWIQRKFNGGWE